MPGAKPEEIIADMLADEVLHHLESPQLQARAIVQRLSDADFEVRLKSLDALLRDDDDDGI
jgi:hypothetical protein